MEVEGVTNLEKIDGSLSFYYKGDINLMARLISDIKVSDATIEDLSLEEIFMHYYE